MKKLNLPKLSGLLVLCILLGSFTRVIAIPTARPQVTPISGDRDFTTQVLPIASLPGVTTLPGGMLVPLGFPAGEKQFEGAGLRVAEFDGGTASLCFSISGTAYGWGGKVGLWTGSRWLLLPTTITNKKESPLSTACTTIAASGTYAFIRWIVDPSRIPLPLMEQTAAPLGTQGPLPSLQPATATIQASATIAATQTRESTPTSTSTSTSTSTATATATSTATATANSTATATSTSTATSTATATPTATATATSTATSTSTATATSTSTPTATSTATATSTSTPTATSTATSTSTSTATSTATATSTSTPTATSTATSTSTPTATATSTSTAASTAVPAPLTITLVADTFAQEATPSQNYGSDAQLWVTFGSGSSQQSFLKFTVSGAAGTVHSATLRVYSTSATVDGPTVYTTASNWTEPGLRWNNRPNVTSIGYDNKGAIAAGVWVEYNVTALVSGNGTYSFVLVNTSTDAVSFSSREGAHPPQLVITFAP